jgi:hypothetical protein
MLEFLHRCIVLERNFTHNTHYYIGCGTMVYRERKVRRRSGERRMNVADGAEDIAATSEV